MLVSSTAMPPAWTTAPAGSFSSGTHAQAVNDKWAYKLSAGYFSQDPLPRPTGTIPNSFNTPYPPYTNKGTAQPKFDARRLRAG